MRVRDAVGKRVRVGDVLRRCESNQKMTVVAFVGKHVEVRMAEPPLWWGGNYHQVWTEIADFPFGARWLRNHIIEREEAA